MFIENIQHLLRNQYVIRPRKREILYDRWMNDDRQFTDTLSGTIVTVPQRTNDSLISGVASLFSQLLLDSRFQRIK
jgi:hypothetical protein